MNTGSGRLRNFYSKTDRPFCRSFDIKCSRSWGECIKSGALSSRAERRFDLNCDLRRILRVGIHQRVGRARTARQVNRRRRARPGGPSPTLGRHCQRSHRSCDGSCARCLTRPPPLPTTPFLCHHETLQETDPADISLLVHVKVEIDAGEKFALHLVDVTQLDTRHL